MPTSPGDSGSGLAKIVEKQMRNWELAQAQRVDVAADATPSDLVAEFVSISRSVASGGSRVATLLGKRLDWPVFDREILQEMAGDDRVRAQLYQLLDERDVSWLEDAVRWLLRGELRKDDYFCRLTETVLAIARQGHAVFLGRGVDLILPPERGLRVRIVAPLAKRAQEFAARTKTSEALAATEIERIDRERDEFRRRHFGKDANDVAQHDLILSLDRLTPGQAVDVIVATLGARGLASG